MKNNTMTNISIWEDFDSPWERRTVETEKESKTENTYVTRKRLPKILWGRVIIAVLILFLIIYGLVTLFRSLIIKKENITDTSSYLVESSATESVEIPYSSTILDAEKQLVVPKISAEDLELLVMAIQHETGCNHMNYLSTRERAEYEKLRSLENPSQAENRRTSELRAIAKNRHKIAQKNVCLVILNRVNTPGFGVEAETEFGSSAKSIEDVLAQQGQFSSETENILWDIQHYTDLSNANQYDPNDEFTYENIKEVLSSRESLPTNLYYEICWRLDYNDSIEEEIQNAKCEMISDSPHVHFHDYVINSRGGFDYLLIFFTNSTNNGYRE